MVVVRRLSASLSRDKEVVKRLGDAVRAAAPVQHDHLVRLLDFGRVDGQVFLCSERVDGRSLREVFDRLTRDRERMPLAFAAWVGVQVCRGLHDAHTRQDAQGDAVGLVHGAMSPRRVLVGFDGEAKVAEMGVALSRWAAPAQLGVGEATLRRYAAPEVQGGAAPDRRSDIYGVGLVLWEALTGRVPDPDMGPAGTLASLAPGVPPAVVTVIERALSAEPSARFPSARAMGEALKRAALEGVTDASLREALGSWMQDLFAQERHERQAALQAAQARTLTRRRALLEEAVDGRVAVMRRAKGRGIWAAVLLGTLAAAGLGGWAMTRTAEAPEVTTVTRGGLQVDVAPGGRVIVDGRVQGEGTSVKVTDVGPGAHLVRVERQGFQPQERQVPVLMGGTSQVSFSLVETVKIAPAVLLFDSRPTRATVRVNGVSVGRTPTRWTTTDPTGSVRVGFERAGFKEVTQRVALRPGLKRTISVTLSPK